MRSVGAVAALALAVATTDASAQNLEEQCFSIIGTWGNAPKYQDYEVPLWEKTIYRSLGRQDYCGDPADYGIPIHYRVQDKA